MSIVFYLLMLMTFLIKLQLGFAARWMQLGIQQYRPFARDKLWGYPVYGAVAAGVGYWLEGVEQRQMKMLNDRKESLLAKRARAAERERELEQ